MTFCETGKAGLYLHVPFCRRKCPYCDFYSVPAQAETLEAYTEAVCRNLKQYADAVPMDTVYFGGGTPSLLSPQQIGSILETAAACFPLAADAEVTLEANPATVTRQQLSQLRAAGVNRISFGVQSLEPEQLRYLGRLHTADEAIRTVEDAAAAGFQSISCDLMLALPEQTPRALSHTIERLTALPIQHVSAYLLKIEPGTPFFAQQEELPPRISICRRFQNWNRPAFCNMRFPILHGRDSTAGTTASTGIAFLIWELVRLPIPAGTGRVLLCRHLSRRFSHSRCSIRKSRTQLPARRRNG